MSFSDIQKESSAPLPRGLEGHLVLAMAQEAFRDFSLFCFAFLKMLEGVLQFCEMVVYRYEVIN